jgi:DNA ligase (NAD+)
MDIEGMGPALVDQLVDTGLVKNPADLYSLTEEQLVPLERMAKKSAENVVNALAASKGRPLDRLLFGLGIRHVGATVAQLLANRFCTMDALENASQEEIAAVPGVGGVIAVSAYDFFQEPHNRATLEKLRQAGVKMESDGGPVVRVADSNLAGKCFVFTGTLEKLVRADAERLVLAHGGRTSSSVSKATDYVVAGEKAGSKLAKAQQLGIAVLTEDEFIELAGIEVGAASPEP